MEKRKRQNAKKVVWDFIQIAQGREKEGAGLLISTRNFDFSCGNQPLCPCEQM
jgi:hypothetical protein